MKLACYLKKYHDYRNVYKILIASTSISAGLIGVANAASMDENGQPIYESPIIHYKHKDTLGIYDYRSVRRGFQVFREVCATCHSAQFFTFRRLVGATHTLEEAKAIAAQYEVEDGPDDEGNMFKRQAKYTDYWPSPYRNKEEAAYMNNGSAPPDATMMVNTKPLMESQIFHLLLGYHDESPAGYNVSEGSYYNIYGTGRIISMPPPLYDGAVEYEDGTPATSSQMAKDVTTFLRFMADPHLEERKRSGVKLLFIFALMSPFIIYYNRLYHNLIRNRKILFKKINWK